MGIDELNALVQHRAVDHPGTRPCPHCGQPINMPTTIPYAVIEGVAGGPESVSLDCPHCGKEAEFPLDL